MAFLIGILCVLLLGLCLHGGGGICADEEISRNETGPFVYMFLNEIAKG